MTAAGDRCSPGARLLAGAAAAARPGVDQRSPLPGWHQTNSARNTPSEPHRYLGDGGTWLDPQVQARALEQLRRIYTEIHREQLERLFEQR